MTQPKVAIRLGTEGKEDVKRDFRETGEAGEAAAARWSRGFEKAADDAESARRRMAASADKIAAIMPQTATQMRINDTVGTGSVLNEGSARISAAAFRELYAEQERLTAGAAALRAQLDPVWAAQQRFNNEMSQARTLIAAGVITLDEYCDKLRIEQGLLNQVSGAHGRVTGSTGAMRAGIQQMAYQAGDMATMWAMQAPLMQIFVSQATQVTGAIGLMAGSAKGFIGFLGGPWGQVLMTSVAIGGMLAASMLDIGKADEEAKKAAEKHKQAVDALNKAMRDSIATAEDKARANYIMAESERIAAMQAEKSLQVALERAKSDAESRRNNARMTARGDVIDPGFVAATREVERLTKELAASQARLAEQTQTAGIARGNYQRSIIDQMLTERGQVSRRYDRQINDAVGRGDADAIARLTQARDAELKKIEEQEKALRSSASARRDGDAATTSQVSKMLMEAFGGSITSTTGGKHVKGSYHYRGQAVDFVPTGGMDAISKDQIRAVLEGAGLTIKELLGPGDKGHGDHFHVAWAGGKGAVDSAQFAQRAAEEQARAALALAKERNSWANNYDTSAFARAGLAKEGEKLADQQKLIKSMNDDISAGTMLLNVEWETRGKSRLEIEAAVELKRYEIDLQRQGLDLSSAEAQALIARKAGQIAFRQALDASVDKMTALRDIGVDVAGNVLNPQNWTSWKNVALSAIGDVTSAFWKLAVVNPIQNKISGGNLPTIGSLFGLFKGSGASAGGSAIGNNYTSAGTHLVGENGPEIVELPQGAKVMTASETRRVMGANDNGLQVRVIKGDLFDVEVTRISAGVSVDTVASAAPAIAVGASNGAQQAVAKRNGRRLA